MQQRPNFPPPKKPTGDGGGQGRFNRFAKLRRPTREHRINEDITESQVRVIGEKGAELLSTRDALARAKSQGVDLVEITKGQDVPIVRLVDYGKFKFEKAKKEKEAKKKQKVIQIKEIKMGPKIDTGDFDRKCKEAINFLNEGDNVKVTMKFRGREMQHTALGVEKLNEFYNKVSESAHMDKKPNLEGRMMSMTLRSKGAKPKPAGTQAAPAPATATAAAST
ncbi:MAG: translation initiation factor IF-3 [Leptospiraceae bacterium]|nr:translation initiation factor IF-3 [Leptospiraceae bacterium]